VDIAPERDDMAVAVLGAGLMQGFADGRFLPERQISRGEGLLGAGRLEEFLRSSLRQRTIRRDRRPTFADVPDGHWLLDSLGRLSGIGAMSAFSSERLLPDRFLTGAELRSIGNDIIQYFGQDVAIIESTQQGLSITLKPAIGELSLRDLRYCWAGGIWHMMPDSLIIPWEERKAGGRLHIAAAEWMVAPADVIPAKDQSWFLAIRRNPVAAIQGRRICDPASAPVFTYTTASGSETAHDRLEAHLDALYAKMRRNAPETAALRDAPTGIASEPFGPPGQAQAAPQKTIQEDIYKENISKSADGMLPVLGCVLDSLSRRPIGGATILVGNRDYTSEKDGTFRFSAPKDSLAEVTAYAEGYEALTLKHRAGFRETPLIIQLRPVQVVFEGVVVDLESSQQISGARVKIDGKSVVSGSDGGFRIPRVAATYHQLSCSAPGYMDTVEIAYADVSGKPYEIRLKPLISGVTSSDDALPQDEPYPEFPVDIQNTQAANGSE